MFPISSYSSSSANVFIYDVFLSFRGEDTRTGFTGNLYLALREKGIKAFMDDQELRMGDVLSQGIVKAIQQSRISIVIFSQNYASSTFCLNELVMIMECFKDKGMVVLPVFYKVDPSDVRHQKGSYGEALTEHEPRFIHDKDKVKKWKLALQEAANIIGQHVIVNQGYEYEHIEKIIQEVYKRIHGSLDNYPVSSESSAHKGKSLVGNDGEQVMSFVDVMSDDPAKIVSYVDAKSKNGAQAEARLSVESNGMVRAKSCTAINPTNGRPPTSGYTGYNSNQNQFQGVASSQSQAKNSNMFLTNSSNSGPNHFQSPSPVSQGQNSNTFGTNTSSPNQSHGLPFISQGRNSNGLGTNNSSPNQSQGLPFVSQGQNSYGFGTNNFNPNLSQGLPFGSQGQNSNGLGTITSSPNQSRGLPFVSQSQNSNGFGTSNFNPNLSQGLPFGGQGQNSDRFGTNSFSSNQSQGLLFGSQGQNSYGLGTITSSPNQSKGPPFVSQSQNSNGFGTNNFNPNLSQGLPFGSQGQNSNELRTYNNYSTNLFPGSSFLGKRFS